MLFGLGIVGTGLLAVPVLAGSASYAIAEAMHWRTGLERKPDEAIGFYGVLIASTLLGLGLIFTPLDPIRALFWSAVINGVVGGAVHGVDHAHVEQPPDDGRIHHEGLAAGRGLGSHGGDGAGRARVVRHVGEVRRVVGCGAPAARCEW